MSEPRPKHWLTSLIIDLMPWASGCAAFLWGYTHIYNQPSTAAWPHAKLIAAIWAALAFSKLAIRQFLPDSFPVRLFFSFVASILLTTLLLYYLLVSVALSSWGRVPTLPLIVTYAVQAGDLMDALGYSLSLLFTVTTLILSAIWLFVHLWANGSAWIKYCNTSSSKPKLASILVLASAIPILQIWHFIEFPPSQAGEPISQTLFASPSQQLQSHASAGSAGDLAETNSRLTYIPREPATPPSNLILIIGDALRSDRLGAFGYHRSLTPHLDALMKKQPSAFSSRMRAVCAESSCGLLGMASSRYVHQLPNHPITLQEILRLHGYEVHMILGGDHTHFYGLREAYGEVDSYFDGRMQSMQYMNDDQLVLDRIATLPAHSPDRPVMLQFHLMSTHGLGRRHLESNIYRPASNYYGRLSTTRKVSNDLREEANNYYDNGIVQFDRIVNSLLMELQIKNYLDNAIVVITGDHGEMLGEHDMLAHAEGVFESSLDIPFVIIEYGRNTIQIEPRTLASQIDIAPTLLKALDISAPSTWSGIPLQTNEEPEAIFFQQGKKTGLYDLSQSNKLLKYWRDWDKSTEFVFDINTDPSERQNLLNETPPEQLRQWRRMVTGSLSSAGNPALESTE